MNGSRSNGNTWLVHNPASGSNSEETLLELQQILAEAGRPPAHVITVPDQPLPTRADLEREQVGLLTVFTGDGTANRALTSLYGWSGEVLVLPGGTQNLLARSLHGEGTLSEIIGRFAAGRLKPVRRPLVRSSAGDALCEIVAGPGAAWSDVRESMRDGEVGELAASAREAIEKSIAGPRVTIADPPLGKDDGYTAVRIYPNEGHRLAVDGYAADGLLDYAKAGLALLSRNFREGPHDELGHHHEVLCSSEVPIELMIDGERATGSLQERFEVGECDLTFLASGEADG